MRATFINAHQILPLDSNGSGYLKRDAANQNAVITQSAIIVENGIIADIIPNASLKKINCDNFINLSGAIITPGLIDCHTHTIFAGNRSAEFIDKLSGVSYEEIAARGGGIQLTTSKTREASFDELLSLSLARVNNFICQGVTTLEIKSGYGLNYEDELKILRVIKELKLKTPIDIVPTFLGAHIVPKEFTNDRIGYINLLCEKLLPEIQRNALADFCDVYCDKGAFSADETEYIISKADQFGLLPRIHTDQFHSIGGIETALKHNALSVDHLELVDETLIRKLKETETVCVLLPGCSFFLRMQYAPARKLLDEGCIVALSTDFNPGSSHILNPHFIMSLAAMQMKMSIPEIFAAYTINAAKALNRSTLTGSIEIGKKADFAVFAAEDLSEIIYSIGQNLNVMTVKDGKIIYQKNYGE
jgi:imidazolonepropionase